MRDGCSGCVGVCLTCFYLFSLNISSLSRNTLGPEKREHFLVHDPLCFCETWLDISVIMHMFPSSESKLHVEDNDLQWSLHPCLNSRRRSNIFLEVGRDKRRHVSGPQTQSQFQKKEHLHHSVMCVIMFFSTGHQTEKTTKKITPPHSSPSLLFASLVKILKIGVLTGRSVKAIPVGGKILELKRQRIFSLLAYILNMLQNITAFQ